MKNHNINLVNGYEVRKHRKVMTPGKKGWIIKSMIVGTLFFGGLLVNQTAVSAAEWQVNEPSAISSRIIPEQSSLTMIKGDTVYNIGVALNIKNPMDLLFDNGYKDGEQYTLLPGTVISWDGNKVEIIDEHGNLVGAGEVTEDMKIDPSKTVAGQTSDTPRNTTSVKQTVTKKHEDTALVSTNKPTETDQTTPKPPVGNEQSNRPQIPLEPEKPTEPDVPIVPEQPENQTELERLKQHLVDLESQLQTAEQELTVAQQNLAAAQEQSSINYDAEILALTNLIAAKEANKITLENELTDLTNQKNTYDVELVTIQADLNDLVTVRQHAAEAVSAAQEALVAIQDTGDLEQIANAEAALQSVQVAYDEITNQVTQAETILSEKQNQIFTVTEALEMKQGELANCDTTNDQAKLAELEVKNSEQKDIQQQIDELKLVVTKKEELVANLKTQIDDTKQKIAAIELKVDRIDAIGKINALDFLTQDIKSGFVNRVNTALTKGEINSIVSEATDANQTAKDEHEAAENAKKLAEAKVSAKSELPNLTFLSEETLNGYVAQIDNAISVEEVNTILTNAQAENQTLKEQHEEEQAAAEKLAKAIKAGVAKLAEMNLTDTQLSDFTAKIEASKSVSEVDSVLAIAQEASDDNDATASAEELAEAKVQALKDIKGLNLTDRMTEFQNAIESSKSVSEINRTVANAKALSAENDAKDKEAAELAKAKTQAVETISGLNLTSDQMADFTQQANGSKTLKELNQIVENAQKASNANDEAEQTAKELAEAKQDAITMLGALNLKDEASKFETRINNAKSVAEVQTAIKDAKTLSEKNDAKDKDAAELADAKTTALETLKGLNLKPDQLALFTEKINAATTVSQINALLLDAKEISEHNSIPQRKTTVTFKIYNQMFKLIDTVVKEVEGDTYSFTLADLGYEGYGYLSGSLSGETSTTEGGNRNIALRLQVPTINDTEKEMAQFYEDFAKTINAQREGLGLNSLTEHATLTEAANIRAKELATKFSHERPDGSDLVTVLKEVEGGSAFNGLAENIAAGNWGKMSGADAAESLFKAWHESPAHNDIMNSSHGVYYGLGIYTDSTGTYAVLLVTKLRNQ